MSTWGSPGRPRKAPPYQLPDAELGAYDEQAEFCLITGVQPSEYDRLNRAQLDAFMRAHRRLHSRR